MTVIVDVELKFTYLVAGWEEFTHDSRMLNTVISLLAFRFLHAPLSIFQTLNILCFNKIMSNFIFWMWKIMFIKSHNTNFFQISGKYYSFDSGYRNRDGFLATYHNHNYYLHDWRRDGGDQKKEMSNYQHVFLRNAIERTFAIWKSRFHILRKILQYPLEK